MQPTDERATALDELYDATYRRPHGATSQDIACVVQLYPTLLALVQQSACLGRDTLPTPNNIGNALRYWATREPRIIGRKGGHGNITRWHVLPVDAAMADPGVRRELVQAPMRSVGDADRIGHPSGSVGASAVVNDPCLADRASKDPFPSSLHACSCCAPRATVAEQATDVAQKATLDPRDKSVDSSKLDPRSDPTLHALTAPAGYHLRGVSTLIDTEGKPVMQWVKTTQDREQERLDALLDAIRSLPDSFRDAHQPFDAPAHLNEDLLCVYPIGDPHLGMYCWAEETGADYDIKIAERLHVEAIKRLTDAAPPAKHALLISLGDYFHCDSNASRTTRSGNILDTDTRWQLVLKVGVRMLRAMVDAALAKHDEVRVLVACGNHDDLSSVMLAMAMDAFYQHEPRVSVDTSPDHYLWHRFGKNLIGVTHGSDAKLEALPAIMAAMKPKDWGETRFRYWLTGHVHHEKVREVPGCVVEAFRTLAPRDAWAHRAGYRADRDMRVDVLHREYGRITRHILGVEQLGGS